MFDEVMKREGGKTAARKAGYVFGSTVFQLLLVFVIITASAAIKAKVIDQPQVEVKFVKAAPPPRAAPPPPPAAAPAQKPPPDRKPPSNLPKPPPPQALIQPQEVKAEMKVDPNEPKEPQYDTSGSADGVVGGVVGAATTNEPPPPPKPVAPSIEDAPVYAKAGYKKPQIQEPGCVERNLGRQGVSEDLIDRIPGGVVAVQFAVRPDGSLFHFKTMSSGIPDRVSSAIWASIQSCRWSPGEDAQGRPVSILVNLPVRFQLQD